jgi:hypothetical protein
MHAKRSITSTSTSTVRHGGLSTSTMGSCGRVGQNDRHHPARARDVPCQKRPIACSACMALLWRVFLRNASHTSKCNEVKPSAHMIRKPLGIGRLEVKATRRNSSKSATFSVIGSRF